MSKARDMAEILSTPPAIYSTDAEVAATYLTQASASSAYLTRSSASTIYEGSPNRNFIINGAMQVAQRGTSASSLTTSGYRTTDRWQFQITTQGTWTMSQENDAPTGSGFRKSTKVLCTTADASPAAGDVVLLSQTIEGQNLQAIKKGTAAAEQLTVSFWVKSNVTGTYIFEIYDADNTRAISKSYTISSSGVWEYKTIVIPADTTGAFDNDNDASVFIQWFLGAGSNFTSGTLNSSAWASPTTANRVVGQVNLASATNNYWQITGVQLEVGDTATPFEFKSAAQDLVECQRYFQRFKGGYGWVGAIGTSLNNGTIGATLMTEMRAIPSLNRSGCQINDYWTNGHSITGITYWEGSTKWVGATFTASGSFSGRFYAFVRDLVGTSGSDYIDASSEL